MRWLGILFLVLATTLAVSAEDWTTADGKTYHNVKIVAKEQDGVRITYTGGVGIIPYYELSEDLQKRFGQDLASLELKRKAAEKALAEATRKIEEQKRQQTEAQKNNQTTSSTPSEPQPQPGVVAPPIAPGSTTPVAPVPAPVVRNEPYPGAKYTYIESQDICYLDSYLANALLLAADGSIVANPPGQNPTISFRVTTDGRKPEAPDEVEGAFILPAPVKGLGANPKMKFLVDGAYITPVLAPDTAAVASSGQDLSTISFQLTPSDAKTILKAKNVNFTLADTTYRIDEDGISNFQQYLGVVDHLPPASTSAMRSYHKFLARLPSLITVISTVCEYIILGGFGVLVAAGVAAFALGVTRFIKM